MGTGVAIGYAGGKGSAEQMVAAAAQSAAWGAALGFILGAGAYYLVGKAPDNAYLQIGNIMNKYDPDPAVQTDIITGQADLTGQAGAVDNQLGLGYDIGTFASNVTGKGVLGFIPDFIGTQYVTDDVVGLFCSNGSLINIPLWWVPTVALNYGGFAAVADISFAADQAGFSYAQQLSVLFKAAPWFVDFAEEIFQDVNPNNDYNAAANAINKEFEPAINPT
jgi:hypothetical protein